MVEMIQGASLPHQKEQRVQTVNQILLRLPRVKVVALEEYGPAPQFAYGGAQKFHGQLLPVEFFLSHLFKKNGEVYAMDVRYHTVLWTLSRHIQP